MVNTINLNKTHCDRGHEFTEANTRRTPRGWRICVTCRRETDRRAKAKARERRANSPVVRAQRRVRMKARVHGILGVPTAFWALVYAEDRGHSTPCLIFTGTITKAGYGVTVYGGRQRKAHRIAYEAVNGAIPINEETGLPFVLDHLCRVPACVNPEHLEPVTDAVNVLRGISPHAINARKTHCVRGHEFTPENTGRDRNGHRFCRECRQARDKVYQRARTERRRALRATRPPREARPAKPKPVKPPRELMPCGTTAAYLRHIRRGEPTDEACREVHAEHARQYRRGGKSGTREGA